MKRVALVVAKRGGLVLFGKRVDNGRYTVPGGHLEDGEDPEAGARRELLEETGLAPTGELKLIDERDVGELKIYTYECEVDAAPTGVDDPDHEADVWGFFDIKDGVPKAMAENLAGPKDADKNVVKDVYGVDLKKAEGDDASETWYHLTDKPDFALDPSYAPQDNSMSIVDRGGRKGIYLAKDPEKWVNGHNYVRPYLAEFHVHPSVKDAPGIHGRYGGEMFVPSEHFDKMRLNRVIPLDAHAREEYGDHGWIESHHDSEFDTSKPIFPRNGHNRLRGYKYTGPDVRQMTPEQHAQHKARWHSYMKENRGIDMDAPDEEDLSKADINPVAGRIVDYTHRTWPNLQDAGYTLTVRHEPSTKSLHADVRQHGKSVGSMVAEYQHPGQIGPAGHDLSDPELVENAHQALKHRAGTLQHEIEPKSLETTLTGLVGQDKLEKMAIADIAGGRISRTKSQDPLMKRYNYHHALTPEHRADGYQLFVDHDAENDRFRAAVTHPSAAGKRQGSLFEGEVGHLNTALEGNTLRVGAAQVLNPEHRNKGLGQAMYEAVYRHAMKKGAKNVTGGHHSTSADAVHRKIAAKHGLNYVSTPSDYHDNAPGPSDNRFGGYEYALKSELAKSEGDEYELWHNPTPPTYTVGVRHKSTGQNVGQATFATDRDEAGKRIGLRGWQVDVKEPHRRKGLATAMYRHAEQAYGMPVQPGDFQTPDGKKFVASLSNKLAKHDTPEFQQWFNGSKVVGPDGKPLRVYHGTSKDQDFSTFNVGQRGAWFTSSPEHASGYARDNDAIKTKYDLATGFTPVNQAPRVIPAYLSLKNPYKMTAEDRQAHMMAPSYEGYQRALFNRIKAKGHDGVDFGDGTYVAFHPNQIKGIFNERPTQHSALNKSEEHDEVDRLLLHPDVAERRMALKVDSVAERHLIRALQDEDKTVRRAAFHHPHFGKHSMNALMRMRDREPLQHMALGRDDVTPEHLEQLYETHKDRPAHEKAAILHAISHHGALGSKLIERMFDDGNGVPLVENLKTPLHIVHQLIEQHLLDPDNDLGRGMARRALQRPDVDPALVGRAFTEGRPDVKLAAAGAPNLPPQLVKDALTRGQLSTHDHEADLRLALLARKDATREHHEHASRDRNNLVREKALRHLQPEAMKKFEADVSAWIGVSLEKATKPQHFAGLVRASTQEGRDLVDHTPDLTAYPPEHSADVQAYRHAILESPKVVEREKGANKDTGITKKVIYQVPATHPTHGGIRYMLKPYHERTPKRWDHLGKNHHFGWAEMTNQALYHAGGIGHLHQNVHVAEHNMGNDLPKEPAVVVKMEPGMDVIHHAPTAWKHATPEVKADARKIALMDFLTNNTDRHSGNVLVNKPARAPLSEGGHLLPNAYDRVMAIDHGRAFQYARALGTPINRKDQEDELDDSLNQYVRGSGLEQLAPLEDTRLTPYERDMESRRSWQPTVDWWGQNSEKIKSAWAQRLEQIKHPGVKAHLQRNFNERARHLDDLARWGLDNFGSKWHSTPVRLYRPGEEE